MVRSRLRLLVLLVILALPSCIVITCGETRAVQRTGEESRKLGGYGAAASRTSNPGSQRSLTAPASGVAGNPRLAPGAGRPTAT